MIDLYGCFKYNEIKYYSTGELIMANIFGQNLTKREILKRVGDISSIAGAREMEYTSGPARGMRAIEVKNGAGLSFTVLPDRNMDISYAAYKGAPLSFISKVGEISPAFYDEKDFLRNFTAGLITTCGLTYCGAPCEDNGISLGLHGRIANTASYDVSVVNEWVGDDYIITIRGTSRQATVFGENVTNTRVITVKLGENKIDIENTVENNAFEKTPFMLLYHLNLGYPLVDDGAVISTNCEYVRPMNDDGERNQDTRFLVEPPQHVAGEQVFFYNSPKNAWARIDNEKLGFGLKISYDGEAMPHFVEWKMMGEGEYVIGLEPANCSSEGIVKNREDGTLRYLEPGESQKITCSFEIV
jgi:galactose mutarotase-like enzyme